MAGITKIQSIVLVCVLSFSAAAIAGTPAPATLTAPTKGTIVGASTTFSWSKGTDVTAYELMLGTTGTGSSNVYNSGSIPSQSVTVTNVPVNGGSLFVTLSSLINGAWESENYKFTETGTPAPATLNGPSTGTVIDGSATFSWTAGTGVTEYRLWVGTTGASSTNVYNSGSTQIQSVNLTNLPTTGGTLFVTVGSLIDGTWESESYTFLEAGSTAPSTLTAPTAGTVINGSATFSWTPGSGITAYQLLVGTEGANSSNVYNSGSTQKQSEALTNLPITGGTLYVTLQSLIDGVWKNEAYTFLDAGTPAPATLTAPGTGTVLGPSATFSWAPGTGVSQYRLYLGTIKAGGNNLYNSGSTQNRSVTFNSVPTTGGTIYVTLGSQINGTWQSENYTFTESPSAAPVFVYPQRAGLAIGQTMTLTGITNNSAAVNWSVSGSGCSGSGCGTFSAATSASGMSVTFTAATTAGQYTVTATNATNNTESVTVPVAVTDLAGMLTYHNNLARTGANTQEYALAPSTVSSATFGKLFSCALDGAVYAQPLWFPNLTIGSSQHNVVFVATQHDSLYAFDADTSTSPCTPLWHANLLNTAHGGTAGETSVPDYPGNQSIGSGSYDIEPEVGVTGTPVIDPTTNTLYVVSKSANAGATSFYQRLHAIDLTTGQEKFSGPVTIAATFPGTGDGGTITTFVARYENQRAGLVLSNGVVYISWAAHEDAPPYYGWLIGYSAANLSQVSVFNDTPNAGYGGIWMSGGAPAVDEFGNLYVLTGNGTFDVTNSSPPNNDYGDSLLQFNSALQVSQYFTPSDQLSDEQNDDDFGSGGAVVLADIPEVGSNPTHLLIGGGKDGALYVTNRDKLGGLGDGYAWQKLNIGFPIFATGAFWNNAYYVAPSYGYLQEYTLNLAKAQLDLQAADTATKFVFPGTTPSLSSMPDNSNGIIWFLDNGQYCTKQSPGCGPAVLHAWNSVNLSSELWNSTQGSGNTPGYAIKFTVPTVANGKVYIGTRGNNTGNPDNTTSVPGELDVYGLLPN